VGLSCLVFEIRLQDRRHYSAIQLLFSVKMFHLVDWLWFRSTGWCLLVQEYGLAPTGSGVRVGAYWFRSTGWCLLQCHSGRTMDGRQTNIGNHHTSGQQKHVLTWKTEAAELYHHENHLYSCFCDSVSLVAVAAPHSPTHYQWAARKRITQCSTKSHRVYLLTRLENLLDPSGRE